MLCRKPPSKTLPPLQGAKLAYRLLTDAKLKQILKELGLSTKGKRDVRVFRLHIVIGALERDLGSWLNRSSASPQDLIKRHKEFVLQYTAQQDSMQPKTVEEIIRDVEALDKKLSEPAPLKRDSAFRFWIFIFVGTAVPDPKLFFFLGLSYR